MWFHAQLSKKILNGIYYRPRRPRQKNQVTRKTRFDSIERSSLNTLNTSEIITSLSEDESFV